MPQKTPAKQKPAPRLTDEFLDGLDSMIGASPIGFAFLAQPARTFAYANGALARIAGRPATEIMGRSPEAVFGRELTERLTPHVMAALASPDGQGQVEVAAELAGRPGDPGIYRIHCHAVRDSSGTHLGTWYLVLEVTRQRQLEAETRDQKMHLQAVMDVVPTGVLVSDAGGRLLYANNEAERIWGHPLISADSPREYSHYRIYHEDGSRTTPEETILARTLKTGEPVLRSKRVVKRSDGTSVSVLSNSVPLCNESGELTGAVVAFYDVTEIEDLQRRQQHLTRIAQAVNADRQLHDVMRLVRDAVVETAGFDRAGLWLYDDAAGGLQGSWGTDKSGSPVDESGEFFPLRPTDDHPFSRLLSGESTIYRALVETGDGTVDPICDGAALALTADDRVIGMVFVDNLVSGKPVTDEALDRLLPFCEQAAMAIERSRLRQTERAQTAWLKEAVRITNHRVKNNLQVALAILDTELIEDGPIDRQTLERIRRQMRIIGSVNEFLGDTSPELETSLGDILERVLGVFEAGRRVSCGLDCEEVVVSTKQATATALILDELVTQASLRGASRMDISLRLRDSDGQVTLEVLDDGAPLPAGFQVDPNATQGPGLVERLARWDLLGRVAYANQQGGGVCVAVEFSQHPQHPGRQ
jgi:PAS domain S-box-containing protein